MIADHISISLYAFNTSAFVRAKAIHDYFEGACMDLDELIDFFNGPRAEFWATELPLQTAKVYLQQALFKYSAEAHARVAANEFGK